MKPYVFSPVVAYNRKHDGNTVHRITTFVCNETEAKVIDPNKLDVMECVGCKVRETYV